MRVAKWMLGTGLCLSLSLASCDCGGTDVADAGGHDALVHDSGRVDSAVIDATTADTTHADTTAADTAATDSAVSDMAVGDTALTDTALTDTALTDSALTDTAVTDTAVTDTAVTDTAVTDTAVSDTAVTDTVATDTAVTDTAATDTAATDTAATDTVATDTALTDTTIADTAAADTTSADLATLDGAGSSDGGGSACVTIAELRAMADGPVDVVTCPAYVTYLRFIGFYMQEVREGPGIMVQTGNTIDPAQDLGLAIGNRITLHVTQLDTVFGSRVISWNGASSIASNDQQTHDVSTDIAQDLSAGAGTAIGEEMESELVVLDTATVVSGGGREYVVSYGTGSVTADLYLYEGSLCVGATFDLVSGFVQDYNGIYTIRSYYLSDTTNIDDSACPLDAVVRVNEVKANVNQGCDLVELRVTEAGSMTGFTVYERNTAVLTFASMAVAKNDYIVLHFNADNTTTCNPTSAWSEYASKTGQPAATHTQNFDSAFDMQLAGDGITGTSSVITVYDSIGTIVDAVLLTDGTSNASNPAEAQAETLRLADEWRKSDGTAAAADFFVDADFIAHAVPDLNAEGTQDVITGHSIQRLDNADTDKMGDWTSTNASPTWGHNNVGQSDLP